MIAIVIAIIAAILAVILTKNDSSPPSPPSPVVPVVPDPPTNLSRNENMTNQTQVSLTWSAPENDGGEIIIDYTVEITFSDGLVYPASGVMTTSFTFSTSVVTGATYSFRV